jgi:uncharacterized protein (TIGR02466 family)|tara:strand:- start:839 stop:1474 length:636 start_codon:yes stop_codon:yes gene_type:complete
MKIDEFFKTPILVEEKTEYLKSLNTACNKYIKEARKKNKARIKKDGDFGMSHHSTPLLDDNNFLDFKKLVGQKSWDFLQYQGFDMSKYTLIYSEMWVQEFSKNGGGHHSAHIHWNQHVSGFYFLKCSEKTSYPIFHDPRVGARVTKLHMRPGLKEIMNGEELVHFKPKPGLLVLFPGYLQHEFAVDNGKEPFRFIHFNLQAIQKEIVKDGF